MSGRCSRSGLVQPHRPAKKLHGHRITGIETLHLDRNINQTVRFDHRSQNAGALIARRSDFEHSIFAPQHSAQKMAAIGPLGELFLEDRLQQRTPVSPRPGQFQHGRTNQLLKGHHRRDRISRQPERQFALNLAEGERLAWPDDQLQKFISAPRSRNTAFVKS